MLFVVNCIKCTSFFKRIHISHHSIQKLIEKTGKIIKKITILSDVSLSVSLFVVPFFESYPRWHLTGEDRMVAVFLGQPLSTIYLTLHELKQYVPFCNISNHALFGAERRNLERSDVNTTLESFKAWNVYFLSTSKRLKHKVVTFNCAIQSRDRHKVIWSPLWMTLTILILQQRR